VDRRVALVTGGTDGIGRAVALRLARQGDRVLLVGRDRRRGEQALAELRAAGPDAGHELLRADLSLLAETARLADEVARRVERLDAMILCAGVLSTVPEWTHEGLERTLALNYLSRYLLARRLLPALETSPAGRLMLVANAGRYRDTLDLEDLQHRRGRPGLRVAGRTQFANDLLAVELAERLRATRVAVTCVYPGMTRTSVWRNARGVSRRVRGAADALAGAVGRTPDAAAATPALLAGGDPVVPGFYGPRARPRRIPARARRADRRRELWTASEALVRDHLPAAGQPHAVTP
jgi:NAD(P)-dependent dehydrogenase (short-subunit alcohol dehydrogenase family)